MAFLGFSVVPHPSAGIRIGSPVNSCPALGLRKAYWHQNSGPRGLRRQVVRATAAQEDILAFGHHITAVDRMKLPISIDRFWSGFDDFLELQKGLSLHENTRLEPGPKNGVGAVISFDFLGGRTYETLQIKDDVNKIWKIDIPRPNALFSFYEATVKAYETPEGPEASMALDVVLVEPDREKRQAVLATSQTPRGTRIRELIDFVLERDGTHLDFSFTVRRDIDSLWGIVSDWNSIEWVENATAVEADMGPPATRTVYFPGGAKTFEVRNKISEEDKTFTYTIESSAGMPVDVYKGTMSLSATEEQKSAGETTVKYSVVFLAKESVDLAEATRSVKQGLENRFVWTQKTLAA